MNLARLTICAKGTCKARIKLQFDREKSTIKLNFTKIILQSWKAFIKISRKKGCNAFKSWLIMLIKMDLMSPKILNLS